MGKGSAELKSSPAQLAAYRRYYYKNLEERRAYGRRNAARWFAAHREQSNTRRKALYQKQRLDPEIMKKIRAQKRASERKIKAMRDASASRPKPLLCEVCGGPGNKDGIVWDHNHDTGEFRGWLCAHCNLILGIVDDDPVRLEKLSSYLRSSAHRQG